MGNYKDRALLAYLPTPLCEVLEYRALMAGEQPEVYRLFEGIEDALQNQFLESATDYGVKRWEAILQITPKATHTLQERKFTILTRLAVELPFTFRMLERMLEKLCGVGGFQIELRAERYELEVAVALTAASALEDARRMVRRVAPANLVVNVFLRYNQHFLLKGFAHGELNRYTHHQLRTQPFA